MKYLPTLFRLLPPGLFDDSDKDSNMTKFLSPFADGLLDAENQIKLLSDNVFPQFSDEENLRNWAVALGIPTDELNLKDLILSQLRKTGGANASFYLDLLGNEGFNNDPDKIIPVCLPYSANSECDDYLWPSDDWRHTFVLFLPRRDTPFNCNDLCDDFILLFQTKKVLRKFQLSKPVHTLLFFLYYE